ncbi:multidrug ABC transporter ATP-binding protein [Rhodococcus sp. SRB_17]|uniref:ABC transporter ATP-binding protein n=1 Tax=Rhodococcus sp. OK302 TaxID=1882769 RepID=UPI000B940A60|nr:ABC transporter ATP-binding protein [Rhodococcus sp. OK302]NMM89989.1 multidrug ABC transporter ATP-binding protein [Rhodococcus sp. SRB_17]OYD68546.1 ATP-binding cassette subfamily B protein [Rhodococcus sp. OK302]
MLAKLLKAYLPPYRWLLAGVLALQLFGAIAALILPTLNARIIDDGVARGDTGFIMSTGGIMLLVSLATILASVASTFLAAKSSMGFGHDVRAAVYKAVGSFSDREFSGFGAPTLITRNTNDVLQIQTLVMLTSSMLVSAPLMCIGGIVMALRENLQMSWLLTISVPLLGITVAIVIARLIPHFRTMQTRIDNINRSLREQLTGMRVIRAFVREPDETMRFDKANKELTDTAMLIGRYQAVLMPTIMLIANMSSVAVLWFGAHLVDTGDMQIGQISAFLAYVMQILMSVLMATMLAVVIPRAAVCADRITEVIDTEPSVPAPTQPLRPTNPYGVVEFGGAGFSYPGAETPVLSGVTMRCLPGTVTAIVGSTGSGKSTLVSLIPRLVDVTAGAVLIDGLDVRGWDQDELFTNFGYVPQKAYLFAGTIATNIRYGNPAATDAEIWDALTIAQADGFVRELSQGLDSPISQGGTNLSGGQRQRLAIARAVVRKPRILVFDDSFSALDMHTDVAVRAALRAVTTSTTVIVVAQRISSVVDADQIMVLDDGSPVGLGDHNFLLANCPTYQEIVASQIPAELSA